MNHSNRIFKALLALCLPVFLSGCFLRSMFGNVIIVPDIATGVNEIITTVFSDSTAAVCQEPGNFNYFECTYIVDGEVIMTTFYLLSEFGFTGVLIDPVILQVPQNVTNVVAMFDDESGAGPRPLIQRQTDAFLVTPSQRVTPETGQKFIILELPDSITAGLTPGDPASGPVFTYTLQFSQMQPIADPVAPVEVKALLTGKAVVDGLTYYVPLLPCTANFANIPALEIPQSDTPLNLQTAVGDLIRQGDNVACDHQGYYYPPLYKTYLPTVSQ
jgi:hypothetical protein